MNKKVFESIIRGREKLEESYEGMDISPLKPFEKTDYYGYDALEFPNGDKPLIYSGDEGDIIVSYNDIMDELAVEIYRESDDGETIAMKTFDDLKSAIEFAKKASNYKSGLSQFILTNYKTFDDVFTQEI